MAQIIRLSELKYAVCLAESKLSKNKIKHVLTTCSVPMEDASYLAALGRRIYNKRTGKKCLT